jgi:hypothetical protein
MFRHILLLAGSVLLACSAAFAASNALSPEEGQKQTEFKKAYGAAADKDERIKAFALLEGAKHYSSWQLIATVLAVAQEDDVKVAGFTTLSKMPARDLSLAKNLVQQFQALKFNDTATRLAYCKAMANSEFKTDVLDTMATYISKQRYPDLSTYQGGGGGVFGGGGSAVNTGSLEQIRKIRKDFEAALAAFNAVANSDVKEANRNTPGLVMKWWQSNAQKFMVQDKALADKYKAEDVPPTTKH